MSPDGTVMDGKPQRLHGELKEASPVDSSPLKAGVTDAGVRRQSKSLSKTPTSLVNLPLNLLAFR